MSDWERLAAGALRHLARGAGVPAGEVEEWLALLVEVGPSPSEGPLSHDLVLPGAGAGLTLFGHGERSARLAPAAARLARDKLGESAASELARLPAVGLSWHVGAAWRGGQRRLKLYFTGAELGAMSAALGLDVDGVAHLGVDLTERGLERPRRYFRLDRVRPEVEWPGPAVTDPPGVSHRILAACGDGKRSLDLIFGPGADLEGLLEVAGDVDLPGAFDPGWLRAWAQEVGAAGFTLRPVAYELDAFADGSLGTDSLVSLSVKGSSSSVPKRSA